MKPTRENLKRFDAVMAEIAALPQNRQVDALLEYLSVVLLRLPLAELRQRRDQLLARFADCGCSYEVCTALLELVDHHLAHRARNEARQTGAARKSAPAKMAVDSPRFRLDPPKPFRPDHPRR